MIQMRQCVFCLLLASSLSASAVETNLLVWNKAASSVDADIRGEPLWPLLEDIAHQTGWHIFVEPGVVRTASTKFRDLPPDSALRMLLGNLSFAFMPQTNGPDFLYVFATKIQNATQSVAATKAKPKHVPNELIVKLKPGADIDAIAKALGAKVIARNDKLHLYELLFPDEATTDAALGQLKTNSDVEAVDYNYILDPPPTPQPLANVPFGSGPVALALDPATPGDPCNPVVGLIDTPIQSLGSQLNPFITKTISVAGDPGTLSTTSPTHATAMAQTILGAVSKAGGGSSSVRIVAVDVYGANETATSWNVALGIQAAVDNGATVLNMSLGGASDSTILDSIIRQALAQGVVIFAAAGNQPVNTPTYPAAIPGVNAVTALGAPGQLAPYANYGSFVGMALPGASVVYIGNQPWVVQGTSPATAYATGVAAGTKSSNCLPWSQIESAMQQKFPVPAK
jgi:hypothetical protein